MVFAAFFFLLVYLLCCRPGFCNGICDGSYLSRERTCTINAFMILSVFFSHANAAIVYSEGLVSLLEGWDRYVLICVSKMGQLMVSTFLLFSGYGIMESMRKKGDAYLSGFMRHRFFKVFYQFELGILCYCGLALSQGQRFTLPEVLSGLTGWTKLGGNPTWFIVVTLAMYLIAYTGLHFQAWRRWGVIGLLSALLYGGLAAFRPTETWWFNTLFCFPAGMLLSCYRMQLERLIARTKIPAWLLGILLVGAAYLPPNAGFLQHPLIYNVKAILFAYGMALAWSCIRFGRVPRLMFWLGGSAVFCFYFYHIMVFKLVTIFSPEHLSAEQFLAICLPLSLFVCWCVMGVHVFLEKKVFRI